MDRGSQHYTWGGDQNHPKEKEMQEGKVVVWGGLKILRKEWKWKAKEKGKDEHVWIAKRNKKAFLSEQGKEIEESNRMGNTWDLFKKIRATKGIVCANIGTIKDKNGKDLTEEEIKERWEEYTE